MLATYKYLHDIGSVTQGPASGVASHQQTQACIALCRIEAPVKTELLPHFDQNNHVNMGLTG